MTSRAARSRRCCWASIPSGWKRVLALRILRRRHPADAARPGARLAGRCSSEGAGADRTDPSGSPNLPGAGAQQLPGRQPDPAGDPQRRPRVPQPALKLDDFLAALDPHPSYQRQPQCRCRASPRQPRHHAGGCFRRSRLHVAGHQPRLLPGADARPQRDDHRPGLGAGRRRRVAGHHSRLHDSGRCGEHRPAGLRPAQAVAHQTRLRRVPAGGGRSNWAGALRRSPRRTAARDLAAEGHVFPPGDRHQQELHSARHCRDGSLRPHPDDHTARSALSAERGPADPVLPAPRDAHRKGQDRRQPAGARRQPDQHGEGPGDVGPRSLHVHPQRLRDNGRSAQQRRAAHHAGAARQSDQSAPATGGIAGRPPRDAEEHGDDKKTRRGIFSFLGAGAGK